MPNVIANNDLYNDYTLSQLMTKGMGSTDDQVKFKCFEIQDSILSAQCIIDEDLVKNETILCGQLGNAERKSSEMAYVQALTL